MRNKDGFAAYHPIVLFLYFAILLGFSMFCMHPVVLCFSFGGGICYYGQLKGSRSLTALLKRVLPLLLITIVINPSFNHAGLTILCYLPSGNPLTLESIAYGIAAGLMLMDILIWFACLHEVITADKIMYLFGRVIPSLALLLSMTLRFVPEFMKHFEQVKEAQQMLGRDVANGPLLRRIRNAISCFSIVVTWSLENAVDTADSMLSRGYGSGKRTAYTLYRLEERDRSLILFLCCTALLLSSGGAAGKLFWRYFPDIRGKITDPLTICFLLTFLVLVFLPAIIHEKEERIWKSFK